MSADNNQAPPRRPLFGKTRERRLVVYGLLFTFGAAVCLLLFATDTFLETGRGRGLYIAAPAMCLLYGVLLTRELLGERPVTYPSRARRTR